MSNTNTIVKILGVVVLTLLGIGWGHITAPVNGEGGPGLFNDVERSAVAEDRAAAFDPTILRSRLVDIDWKVLAVAEDSSGTKTFSGGVLLLNLFEDRSFTALLYHGQARSEIDFIWTGHVNGVKESQVTIVVQNDVMVGNIRVSGEFFQVRYIANGVHVIQEIDETMFPPAGEPIPVDNPPSLAEDQIGSAADDGSTMDVMVVYTPAARAAEGGTTAMTALINLAITETNTAYSNSGVTPRVRLVHTEEVSYTESGSFSTDLNRLTNDADGFIDNVHTLRDTHGADLVSLFLEGGSSCGRAWVMTTLSNTFESFAFSVVSRTCATGNFSFGHELGHNMGIQHDRTAQPLDGVFSYSHGYVDIPNDFRTIMGTVSSCSVCTRIQNFSNPAVNSGGFPTGVDFADPDSADAARSLDNSALTVANWRESVNGGSPPTLDTISPDAGSTTGGTTVTLTGNNFVNGSTTVTLGGDAATNVSVTSATNLTATIPFHAAGTVDVVVTTGAGSATLTSAFTYVDTSVTVPLVASVLPSSRSVEVGTPATVFVTIINAGTVTAFDVEISLSTPLSATLSYQTTDSATNALTGTADTPVDIPAGASQSFVISITPTAAIPSTDVEFAYQGLNANIASTITGVNTLLFSASSTSTPDIVALAATINSDGITNIPGTTGTGIFSVATVNVGAGGTITASADTGSTTLPVTISICQTDTDGACLATPSGSVTTTINANATATFGIFVTGTGTVPFDAATNRIFVRFTDSGVTRGATSVAVRTQP